MTPEQVTKLDAPADDNVSEFVLRLRAAERPADPLVSCLVPAFNEEGNILPMLDTLHTLMKGMHLRHELIVVDDGSHDATVEKVMSVIDRLPVTLVQLSRNFGKEVALTAGIAEARGDLAVLIDCDFQHPPELIPSFIDQWRRGYDMVYAVRSDRNDETRLKRAFTRVFYGLLNLGERNKIPENTQDFRVLDRCLLDARSSQNRWRRWTARTWMCPCGKRCSAVACTGWVNQMFRGWSSPTEPIPLKKQRFCSIACCPMLYQWC